MFPCAVLPRYLRVGIFFWELPIVRERHLIRQSAMATKIGHDHEREEDGNESCKKSG